MYLTTQDDMLQDSGQAGAEIEITSSMVEAGLDAFLDYDPSSDSLAPVLREAFVAMMRAGREDTAS